MIVLNQVHVLNYSLPSANQNPDETTHAHDMSFWPKPAAWARGGLWHGSWSSDCEGWYQRHLEGLRNGKIVVYDPRGWRSSLRFDPNFGKNVRAAANHCHQYLCEQDSSMPLLPPLS